MFFFFLEKKLLKFQFECVNWCIYVIEAVSRLTIDGIKLSLFKIDRIVFQSGACSMSPVMLSSKQIDSSANLTMAGGLTIERTSANCFFLMPLTATRF